VTENVSASLRTKIGKLKQNLSQLSAEHAIWSLRLELPISDAVETSSVVQDRLYVRYFELMMATCLCKNTLS
jgi:hypothetical protein